jgi:hypothetical protein
MAGPGRRICRLRMSTSAPSPARQIAGSVYTSCNSHLLRKSRHPRTKVSTASRCLSRWTDLCFASVRTPLDPPPVIEFRPGDKDPQKYLHSICSPLIRLILARTFLSSPFLFGNVEIASATQRTNLPQVQSAIISGNLVSSLHRVRTEDGEGRAIPFYSSYAC